MSRVEINGIELYYEIRGDKGEPLVFLNGIAMSVNHWTPLIDKLKNDYRVLLHDFRGQLRSGKVDSDFTMDLHAEDLAALMDEAGFQSAHIIGTSYGSEVALIFALAFPGRCRSLTVIDGVSELNPVLQTAVESWKYAALSNPRLFYKTLIPWNYSPAYLRSNLKALREREDIVAGLPGEYFSSFSRLCDAFLRLNITEKLHRITCPVLIVVGELDILKHKGFSEIIRNEIKGSALTVVEGAGHAVVIEQPAETAGLIEDFLLR